MRTGVYVEMGDLREIERALGMAKDKARVILRAAINNAAKQVEGGMVEGARKRYRFREGKSQIRRANSVRKASVGRLSAEVGAKGRANELMDFHVSPMVYVPGGWNPIEWYRARVLRQGRLKRIALRPGAGGDKYKGFIIRYPNSNGKAHYALAQRVPGKRMRSNPRKEAVKSLSAISTPQAEEAVYRYGMGHDVEGILMKSIQEQMHRFLG